MLEQVKVSDEQFTDCIATILLLEGVDLSVLVQQVLDKRLSAVQSHLTSGGSVRTQLSDVSWDCLLYFILIINYFILIINMALCPL